MGFELGFHQAGYELTLNSTDSVSSSVQIAVAAGMGYSAGRIARTAAEPEVWVRLSNDVISRCLEILTVHTNGWYLHFYCCLCERTKPSLQKHPAPGLLFCKILFFLFQKNKKKNTYKVSEAEMQQGAWKHVNNMGYPCFRARFRS